jgi:hypothetical protein
MLLTAGPGCGVGPSHHQPLKDLGRGISLTVVLTMCTAQKDLSVHPWPLWLGGADSNKSLFLSVNWAAMTWRSAESHYAEWEGTIFTVGCLTINTLAPWAAGELGNLHWRQIKFSISGVANGGHDSLSHFHWLCRFSLSFFLSLSFLNPQSSSLLPAQSIPESLSTPLHGPLHHHPTSGKSQKPS